MFGFCWGLYGSRVLGFQAVLGLGRCRGFGVLEVLGSGVLEAL